MEQELDTEAAYHEHEQAIQAFEGSEELSAETEEHYSEDEFAQFFTSDDWVDGAVPAEMDNDDVVPESVFAAEVHADEVYVIGGPATGSGGGGGGSAVSQAISRMPGGGGLAGGEAKGGNNMLIIGLLGLGVVVMLVLFGTGIFKKDDAKPVAQQAEAAVEAIPQQQAVQLSTTDQAYQGAPTPSVAASPGASPTFQMSPPPMASPSPSAAPAPQPAQPNGSAAAQQASPVFNSRPTTAVSSDFVQPTRAGLLAEKNAEAKANQALLSQYQTTTPDGQPQPAAPEVPVITIPKGSQVVMRLIDPVGTWQQSDVRVTTLNDIRDKKGTVLVKAGSLGMISFAAGELNERAINIPNKPILFETPEGNVQFFGEARGPDGFPGIKGKVKKINTGQPGTGKKVLGAIGRIGGRVIGNVNDNLGVSDEINQEVYNQTQNNGGWSVGGGNRVVEIPSNTNFLVIVK